jgi:mRNA interferase MazF
MDVKRGSVFLVDFNPARGSEQAGFRPAIVLQNDIGNEMSPTTIVAAITASQKTYPFMVQLDEGEGGLERASAVNLAQILTIDKTRLRKKTGVLSQDRMKDVDIALKRSLALSLYR